MSGALCESRALASDAERAAAEQRRLEDELSGREAEQKTLADAEEYDKVRGAFDLKIAFQLLRSLSLKRLVKLEPLPRPPACAPR